MAREPSIVQPEDLYLFLGLSSERTSEECRVAQKALLMAEAAIRRYLQYNPVSATHTEYYPQMEASLPSARVWEVNETEAYQRRVDSGAHTELQIRNIPIRSVTSLHVDYDGRSDTGTDPFPASSLWTEGTDFWPNYDMVDSQSNKVCGDGLLRTEGSWPSRPGSVKIVYTAGYTNAELKGEDSVIDALPIYEATLDEAQRRFIKAFSRRKAKAGFIGPLASEGLGEYNYSVDGAARQNILSGSLSRETQETLQPYINYGISFL